MLAWLMVPVSALIAIGPIKEVDLYWHIRMGADILENRRLSGDPAWTYGPSDPAWVTTQAGAEVLLHLLYSLGSWTGVMLLRVVLAAAVTTSVILAATAVVRTRRTLPVDRSVALVSIVTALAMVAYVQERPQSLSLLLVPWVGVLLLRVMYADRWPRWWVVGLVVMVWCWFHGAGAIVAPVLIAATVIHALGAGGLHWLLPLLRSLRKGWAVILAAAVAPMVGPLGLGYYPQASRIQEAATMRILEWTPPGANSAVVWLALVLLGMWALSLVRLAATSGRVWRTFRMDMILVIGLLIVMTSAGRYLGLGILLLGPLVARRLAQVWTRPAVRVERIRPRTAASVVAVVSLVVGVLAVVAAVNVRPVARDYPLQVWRALAEQPDERRALVDYGLGGQAALLGDAVVSIDGRADRYGGEAIDDYLAMTKGLPGWEDTLARYPGTTDAVIPTSSGLADRLAAQGWTVACVDGSFSWLTAPGITGECRSEAAQ
jgi:hypothetical protein